MNHKSGDSSPSASSPVTATLPAAAARSHADISRASPVSRHGSAKAQLPSEVVTAPLMTSQLPSNGLVPAWGN